MQRAKRTDFEVEVECERDVEVLVEERRERGREMGGEEVAGEEVLTRLPLRREASQFRGPLETREKAKACQKRTSRQSATCTRSTSAGTPDSVPHASGPSRRTHRR